jgi:hypothetical protein
MLTKDQIVKMSAEQQEALANVELGRAQFRQKLLNEIRGLNRPWQTGWLIAGSLLMIFVALYLGKETIKSSPPSFVSFLLIILAFNYLGMSYTHSVSRRMDALIKFLEEDGQLDPISKRAAETGKQEL